MVSGDPYDPPFPEHIYLEPTNACNLSCRDCPRGRADRKVSFLDFSLFKSIVREAAEHGPGEFALHKDGEPLLHPDIFRMISHIKETRSDNRIYLSTNGIRMDRTAAKNVLSAGVEWVNISLGAVTPSTYARVKGGTSRQFKAAQANAMNLLEERARVHSGCSVILQIIDQEGTEGEVAAFREKWRSAGAHVGVWSFINWGGAIHSTHEPELPDRYPCPSLWAHPAVNADGRVSACCVDWNCELIVGDLKQKTFREIWRGEEINQLRERHLEGTWDRIKPCAGCNVWARDKRVWVEASQGDRDTRKALD